MPNKNDIEIILRILNNNDTMVHAMHRKVAFGGNSVIQIGYRTRSKIFGVKKNLITAVEVGTTLWSCQNEYLWLHSYWNKFPAGIRDRETNSDRK